MQLKFSFIGLVSLFGCQPPPVETCLSGQPAPVVLPAAHIWIGSDQAYAEEAPRRQVRVRAFDIDASEVTNAQFAVFVSATGYVTQAELPQVGFEAPGGAVFVLPQDRGQAGSWKFVEGANWRHPEGPSSHIIGRDHEPVVQVSYEDARAYAQWIGRALPTESEWEYAASGDRITRPTTVETANSWQGLFPLYNTSEDGYHLRAPVGCYPPNRLGLYDMLGNVWEWTRTPYETADLSYVIKGGSFLCAPNYCQRTRSSARQPQELGLSTNHIGFRTVSSK